MRALGRIVLATLLGLATPAVAETNLRIGGGLFPPGKGNPLRNSAQPYWYIYAAMFDTLTHVNSAGEVEPWLAQRWEQTSPRTWRFHLRPNVAFTNGEPVDASAVAATIAYLTSTEGQREIVAGRMPKGLTVKIIDPLTVDLTVPEADPLLPRRFHELWILPPKKWAADGPEKFAANPAGSGPYAFESWGNARIRMVRNLKSWRQAPTDRLDILSIIEPSARNAALVTGGVDIAMGSAGPDSVDEITRGGGSVHTERLPASIALGLVTLTDKRFRDVRVRQALNYAVDKDAIVKVLLAGGAKVGTQPAIAGALGYNAALAPYPHDPARAKALLAEAGYPNGFSFVMELPTGTALWDAVFPQVAADLTRVGVNMEVRLYPNHIVAQHERDGTWEGSAWAAAYVSTAFDALEPMTRYACGRPNSPFCDETFTPVVNMAMASADPDTRRRATEEAMALARDRAMGVFLYESIAFIGLGPRVKTFATDFAFIRYERLKIAP